MSRYLSPVFISYTILLINILIYMVILKRGTFFEYTLLVFLISILAFGLFTKKNTRREFKSNSSKFGSLISIEDSLYYIKYVVAVSVTAGIYILAMLYIRSGEINPLQVSAHYSYLRYIEGEGIGLDIRFSNVLLYVGVLCGSLVYIERLAIGKPKTLWLLVPAAFAVVESFLLGTKSIIVLTAIYIFLGYRIVSLYHNRKIGNWKILKRGAVYFLLIMTTLVVVQLYRSSGNRSVGDILFLIFSSYTALPTFAFLEASKDISELVNVGVSSISGIGVYFIEGLEKRNVHLYFNTGSSVVRTNVYTAYYYLLLDFGYLGLFAILALIPLLIEKIEQKINEQNLALVGIYISASAFLLFAFADPLFKYMTNIAVCFVFFLMFFIAKKSKYQVKRRRRRHEMEVSESQLDGG